MNATSDKIQANKDAKHNEGLGSNISIAGLGMHIIYQQLCVCFGQFLVKYLDLLNRYSKVI